MTNPTTNDRRTLSGERTTFRARAKVNLSLGILGRRDDGFHELESVVAFADHCSDALDVAPSPCAQVSCAGPFAAFIGDDNLVVRAMEKFRLAAPAARVLDVALDKTIPVAAGLGGGSSDAGAVLRALKHFNPQVSGDIDWNLLAKTLGADVPVCFHDRAAIMRGVGEKVSAVGDLAKLFAVLVNAQRVSPSDKTARVFSKLAASPLKGVVDFSQAPGWMARDLDGGRDEFMRLLQELGNDLDVPAKVVMPEIEKVQMALGQTQGCELVRLSGAGPTCFGLYATMNDAVRAREHIQKNEPGWWVVATSLS